MTYHDYEPELLLVRETWTAWKARARMASSPMDTDLARLKQGLVRAASISGPGEIALLQRIVTKLQERDVAEAARIAGDAAILAHYRIWAEPGAKLGITTLEESFRRLSQNPSILADLTEILEWAAAETTVSGVVPELVFRCPLELHAQYGMRDIQAVFGRATLQTPGQTGVGVLHFPTIKTYALLVTYQKTEREFSPSTMHADYPISRELLHWESQSNTAQESETGRNLIDHEARGYTILVFARDQKRRNGYTMPFTYLGDAQRVWLESERPIKIVWRLRHPMPVEMYENNRRGG